MELSGDIQELRKSDTLSAISLIIASGEEAAREAKLFTLVGIALGITLSITMGSRFVRTYKLHDGILRTTRNITITVDEKGIITSVNTKACDYFEISGDILIGRNFSQIFGTGKMIHLDLPIAKVNNSGIGICNLERFYTASDGWKYVLNVDCLPLGSRKPCGVLVVARDISERKILEDKLYELTLQDGLTGLYNQTYIKRMLGKEIEKSSINSPLAFILMDIDDFKLYNDCFGHLAGDGILQKFGKLIKKCVRETDIVGRYGGDEFAVVLPGTDRETAMIIADRIRAVIESYPFPNKNFMPLGKITASAGISICPDNGSEVEELINKADKSMYKLKRRVKELAVKTKYSAVRDFLQELRHSNLDLYNVVQTMLNIISVKDKDTYLHLEKVLEYAGLLCNSLNLPEKEVKHIKLAALLHDVGKIEIPRVILNKDGPLSGEEWSIVKQHPKWGADMVQAMQYLDNIVPLILHHHERYDGNGYPCGLKGGEIPLGSRIIAVVDSFDAMTNLRPYRKSRDLTGAITELKKNKGSQFDPHIADAFINVLSESGYHPEKNAVL